MTHVMSADDVGAVGEAVRMFVVSRTQEQRGGIDRATRHDHKFGRVTFFCTVALDMDGRDFSSGTICFQARYLRISKQGHIIVSQRRHDTADVRIRFCVNKAGEAVTCVATDAPAVLRIFLIQHDAEWSMKWLQPVQRKVVAQLLNTLLVADRWVREWSTAVRLSRIFADRTMHMINLLRLSVIWFEFVVRNRPGW